MYFNQIKPACDAIATRPTKENVKALQHQLLNMDKRILQTHQVYILVPLITQIEKDEIW